MLSIRGYRESDFPLIKSWWVDQNELPPLPTMLPHDSTFVAEFNRRPIASITVYYTNCKDVAYVENLGGDPAMKGPLRKEAVAMLFSHVDKDAKSRGCKFLGAIGPNEKLERYYNGFGYLTTLRGVSTLAKEVR